MEKDSKLDKSEEENVSPGPIIVSARAKLTKYEWFKSIGSPKYYLAPMVDYSDISFRLLVRRYGTTCCYGPMIHANMYRKSHQYRKIVFSVVEEDRPVIPQFCGNDPAILLEAAQILEREHRVDAIDINFGCPQGIARKGHYGAYLQEELPLCCDLVRTLAKGLTVPVTAKMRCLKTDALTLEFARGLYTSGASMICIHGRLRDAKGICNEVNWDAIRMVRDAIPDIPILGNGGIRSRDEADRRIHEVGVDGIVAGASILANPAVFAEAGSDRPIPDAFGFAEEYMDIVDSLGLLPKHVKAHLFKLLLRKLALHVDIRESLNHSGKKTLEFYREIVAQLKERFEQEKPFVLELDPEVVKRKRQELSDARKKERNTP